MGFFPSWVSVWLTPIWLLSVGVLLGLFAVVLLAGVAWCLSLIPWLGSLWERKKEKHAVCGVVAVIGFVGWFVWNLSTAAQLAPFTADFSWPTAILQALAGTTVVTLVCWIVTYAAIAMIYRRHVREIPLAIQEGVLTYISVVMVSLAFFGIVGTFIAQNPYDLLDSTTRLLSTGKTTQVFTLPVAKSNADPVALPVKFRADELRQLDIESTDDVVFSFDKELPATEGMTVELAPLEPRVILGASRIGLEAEQVEITEVFALNQGDAPAKIKIEAVTWPKYEQTRWVPWVACVVAFIYLAYFAQRSMAPRVSAIALAATKSDIAQPLFTILIGLGAFLFFVFLYLPYSTFGEDIKLLKITGLTLMRVFAIIQAVWAASTSISDEIEGRTALTVLSKPLRRRDFILGKYLGIVWTIVLMFTIFSVILLTVISYKPIYDAREGAYKVTYGGEARDEVDPTWENCFFETSQVLPGISMALMESLVIAAVTVAISTRLPMLANFMISLAVYWVGHLTPLIVKSSVGQFAPVRFFGQLLSTAFPNLELFNPEPAVTTSQIVPPIYLGWLSIYFVLYIFLALLLALVLFEDRDVS